jgi:hypothetical protein
LFTRTTGFLIVPIWLSAMGWLVANDVWPGISAESPPPLEVTDWLQSIEGRQTEYGIEAASGEIGTIWTKYTITESSIQREDVIYVQSHIGELTPLRVTVSSTFSADGKLDEFTLRMTNRDTRMELHGERFHYDFSFTFEGTGIPVRTFKLPLTDAGMINGALNPFSQLSDLHVGKRWRMQVFNPFAAITGFGDKFMPLLVEVTGEETLKTPDGIIDCSVVEAANAKAFVDANGLVRLQEVILPIIGKLTIRYREGFDEDAANAARTRSFKRK